MDPQEITQPEGIVTGITGTADAEVIKAADVAPEGN